MARTILVTTIFILTFSASFWYVRGEQQCPVPIYYRLGEVDYRFGLTKVEARSALAKAEKLWEKETGRELFVYDEKAGFLVNFIYDERQQMARTEEEWSIRLDRQEKESQKILNQAEDLRQKYEQAKNAYEKGRTNFEARLTIYNEAVKKANQQGGASGDDFVLLQAEKESLSVTIESLNQDEEKLKSLVGEINQLNEQANSLVDSYNEEVREYNEVFGTSSSFTQGDFQRQRINIYKFTEPDELVRVLAHEFGHALGLHHVEDEAAVMYYLMKSDLDTSSLTEADKIAFRESCGEKRSLGQVVRGWFLELMH